MILYSVQNESPTKHPVKVYVNHTNRQTGGKDPARCDPLRFTSLPQIVVVSTVSQCTYANDAARIPCLIHVYSLNVH